jgi:serine/threonine protein kinase
MKIPKFFLDRFVELCLRDESLKSYKPTKDVERIPPLKDYPNAGDVVVHGDAIGKGVTGEVFDATIEGGTGFGFPICIKYTKGIGGMPIAPLMFEYAMYPVFAHLDISPRIVYLSPPNDEEIRFVIMEKGGKSLMDLIRESKFHVDIVQTLAGLRQILELLQKLHSTGLVHRDVKVINIIFASPDGKDPLKDKLVLIDFEYARPIGEGYTRAEDVHEAIHDAVKMNPIFKFLFPDFKAFPDAEPYRIREDMLSKAEEEFNTLDETFGPIADKFKALMAEFYSIAPPMSPPGVHGTPEYDKMIALLSISIDMLLKEANI